MIPVKKVGVADGRKSKIVEKFTRVLEYFFCHAFAWHIEEGLEPTQVSVSFFILCFRGKTFKLSGGSVSSLFSQ